MKLPRPNAKQQRVAQLSLLPAWIVTVGMTALCAYAGAFWLSVFWTVAFSVVCYMAFATRSDQL